MLNMLYIKTTDRCNLNCKHCFTGGRNTNGKEWDPEYLLKWVLELAKKQPSLEYGHIELHGGEPLLVNTEKLKRFIKELKTELPNLSIGACTNLTYKLNADKLDLIVSYLDGVVSTSWDNGIRFENVKQEQLWKKNIITLSALGVVPKLNISLSRDVLSIPVKEHLEWLLQMGFDRVAHERITHTGNARTVNPSFPSNAELNAWYLELNDAVEKMGIRNKTQLSALEDVYAKFETGGRVGTFCRNCEQTKMTINPDGTVGGCPNDAQTETYGTIYQPIDSLLKAPGRITRICKETARPDECLRCDVFKYCGSDCYMLPWDASGCPAPKQLMRKLSEQPYEEYTRTNKVFKIRSL